MMKMKTTRSQLLLNVGCGAHFHPAWCNLDLVAHGDEVIVHNIRHGLPLESNSCAAVYHSHVLEHLSPDDARSLLFECMRVLQPGGVLRVVVPDLEGIASQYLVSLDKALKGERESLANHQWMTFELLDQLVRTRCGGKMASFVANAELPNEPFIRMRTGEELFPTMASGTPKARKGLTYRLGKLRRRFSHLRDRFLAMVVYCLGGAAALNAFREGRFRQSGEVHRWMYDRVSLDHLLADIGFSEIKRCAADESRVKGFANYELDFVAGRIRKPDSLFVEAVKPRAAPHKLTQFAA